jgi:hypothetical protein
MFGFRLYKLGFLGGGRVTSRENPYVLYLFSTSIIVVSIDKTVKLCIMIKYDRQRQYSVDHF